MQHRVPVNDYKTKSHWSGNYWQMHGASFNSIVSLSGRFYFAPSDFVLYLSTSWISKQIVTKLQAKEEIYQQLHGFQQI